MASTPGSLTEELRSHGRQNVGLPVSSAHSGE